MTGDPGSAAPVDRAYKNGEPLELRARPRPVTRINRKLLAGVLGLGLLLLAGLVIVALNPPSWRAGTPPTELYNVDNKPKSDELARLPATYDGIATRKLDVPTKGVPLLLRSSDAEGERIEDDRGRLAKQARESAALFRLSMKAVSLSGPDRQSDPTTRPLQQEGSTLAAADRKSTPDGTSQETSDQMRKLAFLRAGPEKEIYNPHALQRPVSPYQLLAGSIISASLVTGLDADLPGFVIAQVTEHAYDTVSGRHLLIPQGSRLIGKYDSVVAYGQQRALVVWQRIIRPDGS